MYTNSQKKQKTPGKIGGVGKFISTTTKAFDFGKANIEVPDEFEVAISKTKELKDTLPKLVQNAKRYGKSFQAYSSAAEDLAQQFKDLEREFEDIVFFASALNQMAAAQIACELSNVDFYMNKVVVTLKEPTEKFINEVVNPALEAKRAWKKARIDYDTTKTKFENLIRHEHCDPQRLIAAQSNFHLERLKEKEKFEKASDALGDTLWMRDFDFFMALMEFMIELHDCMIYAYSIFYELDKFNRSVRSAIVVKKSQFLERQRKREEERKKAEEENLEHLCLCLIDLLSAEDFALLNAMCVTAGVEQDNILANIIKFFDVHQRTLPIIKNCITTEVACTKNPTTLFRGNSIATKLISVFTKMTGRDYLAEISPAIQQVLDDPSGFEIDPNKEPELEIRTKNMVKLLTTCQLFLDAIFPSVHRCPIPFRIVANHLQQEAIKRFPNSQHIAVGGFIFLRFFCPAILSPDTTGLISDTISADARRALLLISKVIQNLANGQKFGQKESFLNDANVFIENNLEKVQNFLDGIAALSEQTDYKPTAPLADSELQFLQVYLVKNLDKIAKTLNIYKNESLIEPLCFVLGEFGDIGVEPDQAKIKKQRDKTKDKKKEK